MRLATIRTAFLAAAPAGTKLANHVAGHQAALLRVGSDEIELMSATRVDSPVGKFIAKRGPGLHHVAYGVEDIDVALAEAREAGLELIDSQPRIGLNGRRKLDEECAPADVARQTFAVYRRVLDPASSRSPIAEVSQERA